MKKELGQVALELGMDDLFDKGSLKVIPEDMKFWFLEGSSHRYRMVPLVHPEEWETIARYFHSRFRLLTIDSTKVEALTLEEHPALVHGEYRGRVPLSAIISDVQYSWKKSSRELCLPQKAIDFLSQNSKSDGGSLRHTLGYEPVQIPDFEK